MISDKRGYGINATCNTYAGTEAVKFIQSKLDEYKGEGWRMFALMNKVISDNGFDFQKRMKEVYNK